MMFGITQKQLIGAIAGIVAYELYRRRQGS